MEFDQNRIFPDNDRNRLLWSGAYNIIYLCNSLLEGLQESKQISEQTKASLEGEAKTIRAFTYFYLFNLYGKVPLLLTTDYRENSLATQSAEVLIYEQVLLDLTDAIDLLEDEYRDEDRTHVNRFVALSLLARVQLYSENWNEAERFSTLVINETDKYELNQDLNNSFLANSSEAIWQISPIGNGGFLTNTWDGYYFVVNDLAPSRAQYSLTEDLIETYPSGDKRLQSWIRYNDEIEEYYSYKYKDRNSLYNITEYSMVLRLAEQYLIRAEARARQGDILGSIRDLDIIRERAELSLFSENYTDFTEDQVLELILEERRREMFTEWGHRWLDLKRTEKTASVLGVENTLLPIPDEERVRNPNLEQNPGY